MGINEAEATQAVLCSGKRFEDEERLSVLAERIRETLRDPPADALQADFEDRDWAVCIYW